MRLHLNGWHTAARYQHKTTCLFCKAAESEDRIEHILTCKTVQRVLPSRLRSATTGVVSCNTWFLFIPTKPERLLAALYIHAIYTMHNKYRHSQDRGEFKQCVDRIVMDIPLAPKLHKFVAEVLRHGS